MVEFNSAQNNGIWLDFSSEIIWKKTIFSFSSQRMLHDLGGLACLPIRIASWKTLFTVSCLFAEHSKYLVILIPLLFCSSMILLTLGRSEAHHSLGPHKLPLPHSQPPLQPPQDVPVLLGLSWGRPWCRLLWWRHRGSGDGPLGSTSPPHFPNRPYWSTRSRPGRRPR